MCQRENQCKDSFAHPFCENPGNTVIFPIYIRAISCMLVMVYEDCDML